MSKEILTLFMNVKTVFVVFKTANARNGGKIMIT